MYYKTRSENEIRSKMLNIRLDRAGENIASRMTTCFKNFIRLELSPLYAAESNGAAQLFMQELVMRARVLLFTPNVDINFGQSPCTMETGCEIICLPSVFKGR